MLLNRGEYGGLGRIACCSRLHGVPTAHQSVPVSPLPLPVSSSTWRLQARELEELAQIYVARGLPYDLARQVSRRAVPFGAGGSPGLSGRWVWMLGGPTRLLPRLTAAGLWQACSGSGAAGPPASNFKRCYCPAGGGCAHREGCDPGPRTRRAGYRCAAVLRCSGAVVLQCWRCGAASSTAACCCGAAMTSQQWPALPSHPTAFRALCALVEHSNTSTATPPPLPPQCRH